MPNQTKLRARPCPSPPRWVYLDGQFVLQAAARVSVFDRCFRYGDGLFETLRVYGGKPFAYEQHLDRLRRGCEFLRIRLPYDFGELKTLALELIRRNQMPEAVLRLHLSRGSGHRGYAPVGDESPLLVMTLDEAPAIENASPARWRLVTASLRLPMRDPLAAFKTCSKLVHVLASAEARERNAQDALFLNTDGDVVETTGANLFWIKDHLVCTPPLTCGALPGITRALVINLCSKLGLDHCEHNTSLDDLLSADAVFLTQSVREIVEVTHLDDIAVRQSPLVKALSQTYHELLVRTFG